MTGVVVRPATGAELGRCLAIRREVFIEEQGVPAEIEMDDHDATSNHFLAFVDDEVAGTARLRVTADGRCKAERVAVRRALRQHGIGRALMRALEDEARAAGHTEIALNAQVAVVDFYERQGYRAEGAEFLEAGIPHRAMRKRLTIN